jgi:hypothetical protein
MLVYPLVVPLNSLSNGILMLIGINRRRASAVQFHSSEELEYVIRESQEGGLLQGEAGDIIRELFDFGELTAGRVMVPRVPSPAYLPVQRLKKPRRYCKAHVIPAIPSTRGAWTISWVSSTSKPWLAD